MPAREHRASRLQDDGDGIGTAERRTQASARQNEEPRAGNRTDDAINDAHALSAFDAQAIDYLVKPVRPERLAAALDRARTFAAGREHAVSGPGQSRTHLCARIRGSLRLIPIEDVHYLQAEEKYVVVHHARGEDLIEESLKSLEEEFGDRFVRIHRNCLVARHELVELKRSPDGHVQAVLRHGHAPLEVSRRCVAALRETVRHL